MNPIRNKFPGEPKHAASISNGVKLLILTQAVDSEDPVLGFFCRWIEELAKKVERVEVICLMEGRHAFPANVRVHSLGKEQGTRTRIGYSISFLSLVWKLRHEYDAVFVHMNQEYVLIAGWLWKLLGKRVYLWRNHYAGSWLTDVAATYCTKVFCTSKHSYMAKYAKTILMPVGVDTERFMPGNREERTPHSILFLSRISPSKRPEMLIEALAMLAKRGVDFTATVVGSPLPQDEAFYEGLKEKVRALSLAEKVAFQSGVPNSATPDLYRAHEIFVNCSPSGMLDKTLFEAAASGCTVLAASADFAELAGPDSHFDTATELFELLRKALVADSQKLDATLVERNSLSALADKLIEAL